ncbi:MAG: diacylglycerol kinase [Deferrisomatales bacterium]
MKPDSWLETLNCAVEGVLHAVKTQRHMRWHTAAALGLLLVSPRLALTPAEFALLCLAAGLVIVAELLNTSLEAAVDVVCEEYHPLAQAAKDVAAGAVLVAAFAAAAVGWVVLYPKLGASVAEAVGGLNARQPILAAAVLLAVLVVVVCLKAGLGRGRPLHGGFPSGHAAVAFAAATVLALHTRDLMVATLSVLLALMVSHSRLLRRVHTWGEVAAGAAIGALVAAILYWWAG